MQLGNNEEKNNVERNVILERNNVWLVVVGGRGLMRVQ